MSSVESIKKFERFLDKETYNHIKEFGHYPHWSDRFVEDKNMEDKDYSRLVGGSVSLEEINERLKTVEKRQKKILKHLKRLESLNKDDGK